MAEEPIDAPPIIVEPPEAFVLINDVKDRVAKRTIKSAQTIGVLTLFVSISGAVISASTMWFTFLRVSHVLLVVLKPPLVPYTGIPTPSDTGMLFQSQVLFVNSGNRAEAVLAARLWVGQLQENGEISGEPGESMAPIVIRAGEIVISNLGLQPGAIGRALQTNKQGAVILETTAVAPDGRLLTRKQELYPAVLLPYRHPQIQIFPGVNRPYSILECNMPAYVDGPLPRPKLKNKCWRR